MRLLLTSGGVTNTLGVVDFSIFPHLGHELMPENTMADAERWAAKMAEMRAVTQSTTRRQSRLPTAPSKSSQRGAGSISPLSFAANSDRRPGGVRTWAAARADQLARQRQAGSRAHLIKLFAALVGPLRTCALCRRRAIWSR